MSKDSRAHMAHPQVSSIGFRPARVPKDTIDALCVEHFRDDKGAIESVDGTTEDKAQI